MTAVDLSGTIALVAIGVLTLNLLMGLLLSVGYNPARQWPHKRLKLFTFHNWTGYAAFVTVMIHAGVLLFSTTPPFRLLDLVYPVHSPVQPFPTTLGAIAFYLLAIAVLTSLRRVRSALGRHWWRLFHWATYGSAAVFFLHGILADPELKNRPTDYLDAEKVFVEICALLFIAAVILRIKHRRGVTRQARA